MPFPRQLIASGVLGGGPTWVTPTDIPAAEAAALKSLHDLTNGASWTNKTNWGKTATAANWFGLTVSVGRVTKITLYGNNMVGDITAFNIGAFTAMTHFDPWANAALAGVMNAWVIPASLRYFRINSTALSGVADISTATGLYAYESQGCGLNAATVDARILNIHINRAVFTYASPVLKIDGTNAAPTGVYQDATPPTTGLEYKYKLQVDPDAEGFNKWTITNT